MKERFTGYLVTQLQQMVREDELGLRVTLFKERLELQLRDRWTVMVTLPSGITYDVEPPVYVDDEVVAQWGTDVTPALMRALFQVVRRAWRCGADFQQVYPDRESDSEHVFAWWNATQKPAVWEVLLDLVEEVLGHRNHYRLFPAQLAARIMERDLSHREACFQLCEQLGDTRENVFREYAFLAQNAKLVREMSDAMKARYSESDMLDAPWRK